MNIFGDDYVRYQIHTEVGRDIEECKTKIKTHKTSNSLTIFHTNIRSLSKNKTALDVVLSANEDLFDVVILSETWKLSNINISKYKNYSSYYNEGCFNKCDGVVIMVKNTLVHEVETVTYDDFKYLRVVIKLKDEKFAITGLYRSPNYNKQHFLQHLNLYMQNKCNSESELFVGDINIDLLNSHESDDYVNLLLENNYKILIKGVTRESSTTKTCLDHAFLRSNLPNCNILPIISQSLITDHSPIMINLNVSQNPEKNKISDKSNQQFRIDYERLKIQLNTKNWTSILSYGNLDQKISSFIETIQDCIIKSKIYLNSKQRKRKEWITHALIKSIKTRDKLYQQYLKDKNNNEIKEKYKKYRNKLNELLNKAKLDHYRNLINTNSNNTRKVWNIVNEMTQRIDKKETIKKIQHNNITYEDDSDIADIFNNYFINKTTDMSKSNNKTSYMPVNIKNNVFSCFLGPINSSDLKTCLNEISENKATGIDNISSRIIKQNFDSLKYPIVELINESIALGYFPKQLKTTVVTPLHKSGSKYNIQNYRPISLTTVLSKLFEKCVKNNIYKFLLKHNILTHRQFGFMKNLSTTDAIAELTKQIYENLNNAKPFMGIFLDLEKAFDTVSHNILLQKLERYGIRGTALKLIESYLADRIQYVKINETYSAPLKIKRGLPQGTVLAPLLFLVYINDIELSINDIENTNIITYADDTVICIRGKTWEDVERTATNALKSIQIWLDNNKLFLNIQKSKFVKFKINNNQNNLSHLKVHKLNCVHNCTCPQITESKTVKYLGLFIDSDMKWKSHIEYTVNKVRKTNYIFHNLKNVAYFKLLKQIYYALVQSVLSYGILAWGGAYKTTLNRIQVAQNIIIRVMLKKDRLYPTEQLYSEANIPTIRQLYSLEIFRYILKNKTEFRILEHRYATRRNINRCCILYQPHLEIAKRSFLYTAPRLYNYLPINLRESQKGFKSHMLKIKIYLKDKMKLIEEIIG